MGVLGDLPFDRLLSLLSKLGQRTGKYFCLCLHLAAFTDDERSFHQDRHPMSVALGAVGGGTNEEGLLETKAGLTSRGTAVFSLLAVLRTQGKQSAVEGDVFAWACRRWAHVVAEVSLLQYWQYH